MNHDSIYVRTGRMSMLTISRIRLATVVAIALAIPMHLAGQNAQVTGLKLGGILGTVVDVNGDPVPNATVVLQGSDSNDRRTVVTGENGFFQFGQVKPVIPYRINVSARDFADWTSATITLERSQSKIVSDIQLQIPAQLTKVQVTYNPEEVATEQFHALEKQRILGVIPNFYVAYDRNTEPLTAKMKFELALKVSVDPVTAAGILVVSAARQAADSPNYGQGWGAYGQRVGAVTADGFSDIMIGGAILPSLLHQDPRYFYQGTGTTSSRFWHAALSPFIARGDNGKSEPNYASLGGDLASGAISNLYFPKSDRGPRLVFGQFALGTAERVGASLAQEFLLSKFTHRGGHIDKSFLASSDK
jgi:hypothetical protein